jgi:hypothetical protein
MSQELQFDKAEYSDVGAAGACSSCHGSVGGGYYAVNDQILCGSCAATLREALANQGSRLGRLVRATGAGLGAAALGTLLYYGVLALSGYEFGLIAIVVGYGVGVAVRWGSYGRGGWRYQTLAMALTYLSIVSAYIPPIIEGIRSANPTTASASASDTSAPTASSTTAGSDSAQPADAGSAGVARILVLGVFLIALACAAPFLAGVENVIGLIIIGIGLYEAWKLNRRVEVVITGPHAVQPAPAAAV